MPHTNIYTTEGIFSVPRSYAVYDETRPIEIKQGEFKRMMSARRHWKAVHFTNSRRISVRNIVVMTNHASDPERVRTLWFVRFGIMPDDERMCVPIGGSFLWQLPYYSSKSVLRSVAEIAPQYDILPFSLQVLIENQATDNVFDPYDFPKCSPVTSIAAHSESLMLLLVKPAPTPNVTQEDLPYHAKYTGQNSALERPRPPEVRSDFHANSFSLQHLV